ncbi:hypothetical protein ACVYSB_004670, partial [Escherichia albertii]
VGWQVDNQMTSTLVCRALMKVYNMRNPLGIWSCTRTEGAVHRESRLVDAEELRTQEQHGRHGACWGNAVMERFLGKPET